MDDNIKNRLAKEVALDLVGAFGTPPKKVKAFSVVSSEGTRIYGISVEGISIQDKQSPTDVLERAQSVCNRPGFGIPGRIMIICCT